MTRFENTLISSVDQSLNVAAAQAIASTENEDGLPSFQINDDSDLASALPGLPGFAMHIVLPSGFQIDEFIPSIKITYWGELNGGFQTVAQAENNGNWRIYTKAIKNSNGDVIAWLQVAQSLESVADNVKSLKDQLLLGLPLVLVLAGIGGYFFADRTLQPIRHISETAQKIEASELSQRISYLGPQDELGQLAATLNQMLQRLEEAFYREKRFTSDAAHELRTPLGILKGQIEVTLTKRRKPAEYVNLLESLQSHVDRLIRLSITMLTLARFEEKTNIRSPQAVNLSDILNNLVAEFALLGTEKGVTINKKIEDSLTLSGDPDQLVQLFINLLDNALKFTPSGELIDVQAFARAAEISVTVHNTGIFVPEKKIPFLFDPFYRTDTSRSSSLGGTGLGLSIAKEIVKNHDGRVEISSTPQIGFLIRMSFPFASID
ncbi:MAG: ATP-binding protein [Chloroflexi bacterium]|nr:ATP-binding protein [Chloroflexota bacterium]